MFSEGIAPSIEDGLVLLNSDPEKPIPASFGVSNNFTTGGSVYFFTHNY